MWIITVIVILCGTLKLVSSSCPRACHCPGEVPRCALGVTLVPDSCGCCRVCARQHNEDCSTREPCDHNKGLECNFGAGYSAIKGICRAKSDGRSCEYNDNIYQNGESFRPDCKHQCSCVDGGVSCVSLCPRELTLPKLFCAKPLLVKAPGRCCEQPVCPEVGEAGGKHYRERQSINDYLGNHNELVLVGEERHNILPAFIRESISRRTCMGQTTPWSPCSKSCGTGLSTRVTSSNSQCKPAKETRICQVRPCSQTPLTHLKNSQKCIHMEKASQPIKLSHAGCHSLNKFRPRYCGSCLDGQCCSPHQTQTVPVWFRCEDGRAVNKNVMIIQSCKCESPCPSSKNMASAFYRHLNDIYKFENK